MSLSEPAMDKAVRILRNALLSHVIPGTVRSSQMEDEQVLETGNEEDTTIRINYFSRPEKVNAWLFFCQIVHFRQICAAEICFTLTSLNNMECMMWGGHHLHKWFTSHNMRFYYSHLSRAHYINLMCSVFLSTACVSTENEMLFLS